MRIKLGIPINLHKIANMVGVVVNNCSDRLITHIVTDSREASYQDLFLCLQGERFDGNDYAEDVIAKGAIPFSNRTHSMGIIVKDTKEGLLLLAKEYLNLLPSVKHKIAVTGSVGKTTTKEFIRTILMTEFKVHATEGNLNNDLGVPLTILQTPKNSEIIILEMGMNHEGEIKRLSEAFSPDIGVITNIGTSHIGNLGSKGAIARAKKEIMFGVKEGSIIVPKNEPLLMDIKNKICFSTSDILSDYYISQDDCGITNIYSKGEMITKAHFVKKEQHYLECLISASAASSEAGISRKGLGVGISNISGVNLRQRLIVCKNRNFIDDSYNASLESFLASYETYKYISNGQRGSILIGDILELGAFSDSIHYALGKSIPSVLFDKIFIIGEKAKIVAAGAMEKGFIKENIFINNDVKRIDITARQIIENTYDGQYILMKASRRIKLEDVIEYLNKDEV